MTQLADRLNDHVSPSLVDLGGPDVVLREGAILSQHLFADRMVGAIALSEGLLPGPLADIAFKVLSENPFPPVLAAAIQLLSRAELSPYQTKQAQRILASRTQQRQDGLQAELASECLAGVFLFAGTEGGSQAAVVAALDDIDALDPAILVRRAARLAGLAWLWRRSEDLKALLKRLAGNDEAGEQALRELALIDLEEALSQPTEEELIQGLGRAAESFRITLCADPELTEAEILYHALQALLKFCEAGAAIEIERSIRAAREATFDRNLELDRTSLRAWLRPTVAAEVAWYELASGLQGLSERLEERSWLHAVPVLQQLVRLRGALIPIADAQGERLRGVITTRIANGIVAREGLRAHVSAWANDNAASEEDRLQARDLLQAIEAARHRTPGKPEGLTGEAPPFSPNSSARTKLAALEELSSVFQASALTGKFEEVYLALDAVLSSHPDYQRDVQRDVRVLLTHLLLYLGHCLDTTQRMAEGQFAFLFAREDAEPLEIELQKSLWTHLRLQAHGFPQHQILREVADIAAGRADIAIIRPTWRAVIEVKRETDNASRKAISKYLGQAASYSLTGPRISFLVVLDLCSQKNWTFTLEDNCWIEPVAGTGDSAARFVVVWRVPGKRRVPSATRTPECI